MRLFVYSFACLLLSCFAKAEIPAAPLSYSYTVIEEYPHDPKLFTQGVFFYQNKLYESAGGYGKSELTVRDLLSHSPQIRRSLPRQYFAEGISLLNNKIYQLSWKSGQAFVYQLEDLKLIQQLSYQGQGWGLCNNGEQLIMSDGSSLLHFIEADTFQISRSIRVTEQGQPLSNLNELEWIEGKIYANIWLSNRIVIINPVSGVVEANIDLTGLLPKKLQRSNTYVLNGIAYDAVNQRLLVTGKHWPRLYHIALIPISAQ